MRQPLYKAESSSKRITAKGAFRFSLVGYSHVPGWMQPWCIWLSGSEIWSYGGPCLCTEVRQAAMMAHDERVSKLYVVSRRIVTCKPYGQEIASMSASQAVPLGHPMTLTCLAQGCKTACS